MTTPIEPAEPRSGTQAVERALAILECFRRDVGALGISEIAREVHLNVSTAHRLARALVHAGFMEQEPNTERYRLGAAIAVLGQRALEQSGYALAQPILSRLTERTGESTTLGVRRGEEVLVVERAASPLPLRFDHTTGAELNMHVSAMGKVLLAFSQGDPTDIVARLPQLTRFTKRTITARSALVAELTRTRERGYAINLEERYEGVNAIAAPVFGSTGTAHAAVGLQGPAMRLGEDRLHELAAVVRAAADEIGTLVLRAV